MKASFLRADLQAWEGFGPSIGDFAGHWDSCTILVLEGHLHKEQLTVRPGRPPA